MPANDTPPREAQQGPSTYADVHRLQYPAAGRSRRPLKRYLDIYVRYGPDRICETLAMAVRALVRCLALTGLPVPAIIDTDTDDFGRAGVPGIVCRWYFTEPLPPDVWVKLARRLQNRCWRSDFWAGAIGECGRAIEPPAIAHLLVGDRRDPRPALAVRLPSRRRRW